MGREGLHHKPGRVRISRVGRVVPPPAVAVLIGPEEAEGCAPGGGRRPLGGQAQNRQCCRVRVGAGVVGRQTITRISGRDVARPSAPLALLAGQPLLGRHQWRSSRHAAGRQGGEGEPLTVSPVIGGIGRSEQPSVYPSALLGQFESCDQVGPAQGRRIHTQGMSIEDKKGEAPRLVDATNLDVGLDVTGEEGEPPFGHCCVGPGRCQGQNGIGRRRQVGLAGSGGRRDGPVGAELGAQPLGTRPDAEGGRTREAGDGDRKGGDAGGWSCGGRRSRVDHDDQEGHESYRRQQAVDGHWVRLAFQGDKPGGWHGASRPATEPVPCSRRYGLNDTTGRHPDSLHPCG